MMHDMTNNTGSHAFMLYNLAFVTSLSPFLCSRGGGSKIAETATSSSTHALANLPSDAEVAAAMDAVGLFLPCHAHTAPQLAREETVQRLGQGRPVAAGAAAPQPGAAAPPRPGAAAAAAAGGKCMSGAQIKGEEAGGEGAGGQEGQQEGPHDDGVNASARPAVSIFANNFQVITYIAQVKCQSICCMHEFQLPSHLDHGTQFCGVHKRAHVSTHM